MIPRLLALATFGFLVVFELFGGAGTAPAQEMSTGEREPRLERHPVSVARNGARNSAQAADSLTGFLGTYDRERARSIERHYREVGNAEKRVLEERFGLIRHSFRVSADPRGIYSYWDPKRHSSWIRFEVLREITEGWYSAYYFFDGVIRPNVFAGTRRVYSDETAVHEKVHLIQPRLYAAIGLECHWKRLDDPCAASMEPVAAYLTEYAMLKRIAPGLDDKSLNRRLQRRFEREAERCDANRSLARCPDSRRVQEYLVLPIEIARFVDQYGLEGGLRRFVEAIDEGDVVVEPRSSAGI